MAAIVVANRLASKAYPVQALARMHSGVGCVMRSREGRHRLVYRHRLDQFRARTDGLFRDIWREAVFEDL